jgi:hypothetical protein
MQAHRALQTNSRELLQHLPETLEKLLEHKTATTAGLQDGASQLLSLLLPTARDTYTHTEGAQQ